MTALLEGRNLTRSFSTYQRDVLALPSVSLTVEPGELLVLTGPSGSGKSTLLNLLSSLDEPSSGEVCFDGLNLASLTPRELAALRNSRFGFIFQIPHTLPHKTVLENVLMPFQYGTTRSPGSAQERAGELLDYVGLERVARHFPATLSGGELACGVCPRAGAGS